MKKTLSVLLLTALLSGFAVAQKEDKSNLNRAKQYVTRVESALKKGNSILDKSTQDSALDSATTQLENAGELLGKAKEFLDQVSSGFAGRSEVEADYNQAKAAHEALGQRIAAAKGEIEKNDATNAAGAANDSNTVEALSDNLTRLAATARGGNGNVELAKNWSLYREQAQGLIEKYGKKGSRGANREFTALVGRLKTDLESAESSVKAMPQKHGATYRNLINDLRARVDATVRDKSYADFALMIPSMKKSLLERIETYDQLCKDVPGFDATLLVDAGAAIKHAEETEKRLEKEVIQANRLPRDVYAGSDKAQLTALIRKNYLNQYPSAKILRIIFNFESWNREVKWTWDDGVWTKSDQSELHLFVVVQGQNPAHAYLFPARFTRNHLNGALTTAVPVGADKKASPMWTVLVSNMK